MTAPRGITVRVSFLESMESINNPNLVMEDLSFLKKHLNYNFLKDFQSKQPKDFRNFIGGVWRGLLFHSTCPNSNIRSQVYRTTGMFLIKVFPYCRSIMTEQFAEQTYVTNVPSYRSSLIVAVFGYISQNIAPDQLHTFIQTVPIVDHLSNTQSMLGDNLSTIISEFGFVTDEWLLSCLKSLSNIAISSETQSLSSAIAALIKRNKRRLLPEFFKLLFERSDLAKHLALISYVIGEGPIYYIDLMPAASASLEVLKLHSERSRSQIDSAFKILGTQTDSFSTSVMISDDLKIVRISVSKRNFNCNTETEQKEKSELDFIELYVSDFISIPSFYSLPLSLELLKPKSEDSRNVIAEKINSLANHFQSGIYETFYDQIINGDDYISGCAVAALSKCVNRFFDRTVFEVGSLITRAIFTESKSWARCVDIISVIKALDARTIFRLGVGFQKKLSEKVTEFIFSKSDKLSKTAIDCLPLLTYNPIDLISKRIDFLDEFSTLRGATAISKLPYQNHWVYDSLSESVEYFIDSPAVLGAIFSAIIKHTPRNMTKITKIAFGIVHAFVEVLEGSVWETSLPLEFSNRMRLVVTSAIDMWDTDITSINSDILQIPKAAIQFVLKNNVNDLGVPFSISLIGNCHPLFPGPICSFVMRQWESLLPQSQEQYLTNDFSTFDSLVPLIEHFTRYPTRSRLMPKLRVNAKYLLRNADLPADVAIEIAVFLLSFFFDTWGDVVAYIRRADRTTRINFIGLMDATYSDAKELLAGDFYSDVTDLMALPEAKPVKIPIPPKETELDMYSRLMRAACENNLPLIRKSLSEFAQSREKVPIKDLPLSKEAVEVVSEFVARHDPKGLDSEEALLSVTSDWRQPALTSLFLRRDSIIDDLLRTDRIRRKYIYGLSAALPLVPFDATKLAALIVRLMFESKSVRRFQSVLVLLAVYARSFQFPLEIVDQLSDAVGALGMLPPLEASLAIEQLRVRHSNARLWSLAADICQREPPASPPVMRLLAFYHMPSQIDFTFGVAAPISLVARELRLARAILNRGTIAHAVMAFIVQEFAKIRAEPLLMEECVELMSAVADDVSLVEANEIISNAVFGSIVASQGSPQFEDLCRLLPLCMRNYAGAAHDRCEKISVALFSRQVSAEFMPNALSAFLEHVAELKGRPAVQAQNAAVLVQSFLANTKTPHVREGLRDIAEGLSEAVAPSCAVAALVENALPRAAFADVFPAMLHVAMKYRSDQGVTDALAQAFMTVQVRAHAFALALAQERREPRLAISLSLFDSDCEASDKILMSFPAK